MEVKPRDGRSRAITGRHASPVLTLFAGSLFAASASTAHGTDLRGGSRTKVTELISQEQRGYQGAQHTYRRLHQQVAALGREAGDPSPDDLVVHQQDVQAVGNALWAGGATGMQIMDQRLISTSAVRCVGNTLILQGVVYSPPFRITATGAPDRLRAALDASPEIQIS